MKLSVKTGLCCGSGMCVAIAKTYFALDEHGQVVLLKDEIATTDLPAVDEAIQCCPTEAIEVAE